MMAGLIIAVVMLVIVSVVLGLTVTDSFGLAPALFDKPFEDRLERVKKVIPYVSEMKPKSTYDSYTPSDEAVVVQLLQSRKCLVEWEQKVQARQLLDRYDPVRLQAKIDELETKLGLSSGNAPEKPNETHSKKKAPKKRVWGSGGLYL